MAERSRVPSLQHSIRALQRLDVHPVIFGVLVGLLGLGMLALVAPVAIVEPDWPLFLVIAVGAGVGHWLKLR